MLIDDFNDRLNNILQVCDLHLQRLSFAKNSIVDVFPIDANSYDLLSDEQISYTDQLIYRFSKLQDTIGNKLFPVILEGLKEDVDNLPFIDILTKIEKLKLIDSSNQWLMLREIRNQATHEYPFNKDMLVEGLNELVSQCDVLVDIYNGLRGFVKVRFGVL